MICGLFKHLLTAFVSNSLFLIFYETFGIVLESSFTLNQVKYLYVPNLTHTISPYNGLFPAAHSAQ